MSTAAPFTALVGVAAAGGVRNLQAEVLVTNGRMGMLLGSVSQHCATYAKCSTLIVREPR